MAKGDVVRIDYDLYIVSSDGKEDLFDTTNEELAKKEKIHDEKKKYESVPIIVGYDRTINGLDTSLLESSVGSEYDITVPPKDAAGERNPKLVELISIREWNRDNKDDPQIGMEIVRKGKKGTITGMAAGRIRIDFNNPLAGKTLKYKYKVVKKAEEYDEKVRDIIHMDYGMGDEFGVTISGEDAEILMPDVCKYDPNWAPSKFKIVSDLRDIINIKKVRFVEEYVKKEEEKKEEAPEEKKEEAAEEVEEAKAEEEKEEKV
ncbi:MAG: FKBP-type peptidyl-prolyl cis-trans isomerase, partial [Thermoplasmata archaeon]|nr:FKBP-type peptidyl-prolyl cis-trans isomerase [Thermoplasmata archaeon]